MLRGMQMLCKIILPFKARDAHCSQSVDGGVLDDSLLKDSGGSRVVDK